MLSQTFYFCSYFSQRFEARVSEGSQQVTVSGVRPGASYQLVVAGKNGSVLLDETVELGEEASQPASSSLNQCSSSFDSGNHNETFLILFKDETPQTFSICAKVCEFVILQCPRPRRCLPRLRTSLTMTPTTKHTPQ